MSDLVACEEKRRWDQRRGLPVVRINLSTPVKTGLGVSDHKGQVHLKAPVHDPLWIKGYLGLTPKGYFWPDPKTSRTGNGAGAGGRSGGGYGDGTGSGAGRGSSNPSKAILSYNGLQVDRRYRVVGWYRYVGEPWEHLHEVWEAGSQRSLSTIAIGEPPVEITNFSIFDITDEIEIS